MLLKVVNRTAFTTAVVFFFDCIIQLYIDLEFQISKSPWTNHKKIIKN